jgi:transposase
MDPFYSNLVEDCFPNAKLVVDHYHIIAHALKKMIELKNILQTVHKKRFTLNLVLRKPIFKLTKEEYNSLHPLFNTYPEVKKAWIIIQEVRKIYYQKNWKGANSQFRWVLKLCLDSEITEMIELAQTLNRWKEPILNYYISKTTNAVTEALHAKFELIKRQHCGIRNVARFAKRLMFCTLPFSYILQNLAQFIY